MALAGKINWIEGLIGSIRRSVCDCANNLCPGWTSSLQLTPFGHT